MIIQFLGAAGVSIVLTDSLKKLLKQTAVQLKGAAKRKADVTSPRDNSKSLYILVDKLHGNVEGDITLEAMSAHQCLLELDEL